MPIVNRIAYLAAEIAEWRHDLHAHPELQYDVKRTAAFVADKLKAFGCDEVVPGLGRTGVVGVIHGRKGKSDKVIGLRADMDALPIEEETGLPYKSTAPCKMHACGHDGHTAMLLGAARYLAETRNFAGTAVVIFQPAEEKVLLLQLDRRFDPARRPRNQAATARQQLRFLRERGNGTAAAADLRADSQRGLRFRRDAAPGTRSMRGAVEGGRYRRAADYQSLRRYRFMEGGADAGAVRQ